MERKLEFVMLATQPGANASALCRRFEVSREAGYRTTRAYRERGAEGLEPRSHCPNHSPTRTPSPIEALVVALRDAHPAWGGRKIERRLRDLGHERVPAPSTITGILRRHGRLDPEAPRSRAWRRFEHAAPNDLWQMDHKGHFALEPRGRRAPQRCHPLTVLDDHSRFSIALKASGDERAETVRGHLTEVFRRYGLPRRRLMDNGSPWGSDAEHPWTVLTVWLLRPGIEVAHSGAYHPQTQGKDERFHRALAAEVPR